jgi:hypothetical protein
VLHQISGWQLQSGQVSCAGYRLVNTTGTRLHLFTSMLLLLLLLLLTQQAPE